VYLAGGADRSSLETYLDPEKKTLPDANSPDFDNAVGFSQKVRGNQFATAALVSTGAGLVAAGVLTYFLFPPESSAQLSFAPHAGGGDLVLSGRF
jgi:hypothetical protein